ncbi:MAG TPA: hypothetical protein VKB59_07185 [Micromonosporaceae bacterium]|nr:hypothetical protein [Micromonosporaceae bacterium]
MTDDVQVHARGSSFLVLTDYGGRGGDVFIAMLKLSQLQWKLRRRLPIWAIAASVS